MAEIDNLWNEADDKALDLIEREARKILRDDPNLYEFVMAMGSCFFTAKEGGQYDFNNPIFNNEDYYETYLDNGGIIADDHLIIQDDDFQSEFFAMVDELDEKFHSKGYPIRFTATSKPVHDWGDTRKNPVIYEDV